MSIDVGAVLPQIVASVIAGVVVAGVAGLVGRYIGAVEERKDWLQREVYPDVSEEFSLIRGLGVLPQSIPDTRRSDDWENAAYVSNWESTDSYYKNKIHSESRGQLDDYSATINALNEYDVGNPSKEFVERFPTRLTEPPGSNTDPSDEVYLTRGVGTGRISASTWVRIYHPVFLSAEGPDDLREKMMERTRTIYRATSETSFERAWDEVYPEWNEQLWDMILNAEGQPWEDIRKQRDEFDALQSQIERLEEQLEQKMSGPWWHFW